MFLYGTVYSSTHKRAGKSFSAESHFSSYPSSQTITNLLAGLGSPDGRPITTEAALGSALAACLAALVCI